jgi:hypothetical protein
MVPDKVCCPECSSADVLFSKKRGVHICEDCRHEFTPRKSFVSRRLFISYGHDEHTSLAERLRNDLAARGHQVWFDAQRLVAGHDWEAEIERGLEHLAADKANAAVLLLLTPYAVRRPDGYCLNEVARAIATGLRIIPLMVIESEPPLSICRVQWLDMRKCIPIEQQEAAYRLQFDRLVQAVEEGRLDFEGAQQRLIQALRPLEFEAELIQHLLRFTGRQWVLDRVTDWLAQDMPQQRVFWISGGPGVGKTALSAALSDRFREVAALHLCKFGHDQKSDPRAVVTSVAYQLSTQLPEYEARLSALDLERLHRDNAATMFDNLIVQPLTGLSIPSRPIAILIDALDEATSGQSNELANFIRDEFSKTPTWLRLIVTSRPERAVTVPLQAYNPFVLNIEAEPNRDDIRAYLRRALADQFEGRFDIDERVEQVLEKSEGVFLYVERVCEDIKAGNLSVDRLGEFPRGLGGVYDRFFSRQFPDIDAYRRNVRPALRTILAARGGMPLNALQQVFRWTDEDIRDFARVLGSLFPTSGPPGAEVLKPYHKSIADWLMDEVRSGKFYISRAEGHRLLADYCLANWSPDQSFIASEAVYHLCQVGRGAEAAVLLADPAFHEAKFSVAGEIGLIEDYKLLAEACTGAETAGIDRLTPSGRASYCAAALLLFSRRHPELREGTATLSAYTASGGDPAVLGRARELLAPRIAQAKAAPREQQESCHYAARTRRFLQEYQQHALEAVDLALAREPLLLKEAIWTAVRDKAIFEEDGDPIGAVDMYVGYAREDFDLRMAALDGIVPLLPATGSN